MGRRCRCPGSLRCGDSDLRSAASVYGRWAATVITWLDDNAEAIALTALLAICWFMAMVA